MMLQRDTYAIVSSKSQAKKGTFGSLQRDGLWQISKLKPFGETLQHSLENTRIDKEDGYALWVEEDYCSPLLAMERESVLNTSNRRWLSASRIDILQGDNI